MSDNDCGLEIGDKIKVIDSSYDGQESDGKYSKGEIVTVTSLDGDGIPVIKRGDGSTTVFQLNKRKWREVGVVMCNDKDFDLEIGDKIKYVYSVSECGKHNVFDFGDILTVVQLDGDGAPNFTNGSVTGFFDLISRGWERVFDNENEPKQATTIDLKHLLELLAKANCSVSLTQQQIYLYDNDRDFEVAGIELDRLYELLDAKIKWLELLERRMINE